MTTYLYLKDGEVHANEFPEEPVHPRAPKDGKIMPVPGYRKWSKEEDDYKLAVDHYNATVAALKASGAKLLLEGDIKPYVYNFEGVICITGEGKLKEGKLYDVPIGWKVEYESIPCKDAAGKCGDGCWGSNTGCKHPDKIARLCAIPSFTVNVTG